MFKFLLGISFQLCLLSVSSQCLPTTEELKILKSIYDAAVDSFLKYSPSYVVLDSTENSHLSRENFGRYILSPKSYAIVFKRFDSSWTSFLTEVKANQPILRDFSIPPLDSKLPAINRRDIPIRQGVLQLSDIILSKMGDKAILEVSRVSGELNAEGYLFFMEKTADGKWKVSQMVNIWVS